VTADTQKPPSQSTLKKTAIFGLSWAARPESSG